ncbi:MAG: FAD-dependent oxidoreductase [Nitrospira bacterium HGW-Nitrospira-1]|nr:MAG: FAD-dependent oxidoreductase [Nitrospira bacterium HGW-Nitrospira-1]
MHNTVNRENTMVILGGGLTGLSAGYVLSKAGFSVKVFESDATVGGLSKTIVKDGFRFDLGGHRFFTKDASIDGFVRDLMKGELITVNRTSKIYLRNKFFDYPLKPLNAMFGLGLPTTFRIMCDYGIERLRNLLKEKERISLEDWVVSNFGRTMFNIYFKQYSEKVWGIDCDRISAEWVAQRIKGLSLAKAVKNAFFKFTGKDIPTLTDNFLYPELGIGRISDRLRDEIEIENAVYTNTTVESVNHSNFRIDSIVVKNQGSARIVCGEEFISSMPATKLLSILNPAPPQGILDAASRLKFRGLVIVTIMVDRKRVTDQTWIYIPEQKIPFGRIHEPTNWSDKMAPPGKTLIVTEFFSFKGDSLWNETDERLKDITIENLEKLGFIKRDEVIDAMVVRVQKAYPLFEVGYKELCKKVYDYLALFGNLHVAGRTGMFRYYNMDHAIKSGLTTAEKIIKNMQDTRCRIQDEEKIQDKNHVSCILNHVS